MPPKKSYEDIYPWRDANKWGISASAEALKWACKTWEEGLIEGEADYDGLVDFIEKQEATLKNIRYKSSATTSGGAAGQSETSSGTPGPASGTRRGTDRYSGRTEPTKPSSHRPI